MTQFPNARKGLRWIFWTQLIMVICLVAAVLVVWVPVLGFVLGLVLLLGTIVSAVWYLVALYVAGRDDKGYRYALAVVLVKAVLGFLIPAEEGTAGAVVMDSVNMLLDLAAIFLVCTATDRLLTAVSSEAAGQGAGLWKLYLAITVLYIVCQVLAYTIPVLAFVLLLVSLLLSIGGMVLYMIFLYKSYHALEAAAE